jgi:hypothetical protein
MVKFALKKIKTIAQTKEYFWIFYSLVVQPNRTERQGQTRGLKHVPVKSCDMFFFALSKQRKIFFKYVTVP